MGTASVHRHRTGARSVLTDTDDRSRSAMMSLSWLAAAIESEVSLHVELVEPAAQLCARVDVQFAVYPGEVDFGGLNADEQCAATSRLVIPAAASWATRRLDAVSKPARDV